MFFYIAKKNIKRNPAAEKIVNLILDNYDINSSKNVNMALKKELCYIFEKFLMLKFINLGYDNNSPKIKDTSAAGYKMH